MVTMVTTNLEDARRLLELVETRLELGLWTWELATSELRWSMGLFRILGLDPRSTSPSFDLYGQLVHPEDRLDFSGAPGIALGGVLDERNFRIIRPTGDLRWVRSFGMPIHDGAGHVARIVGFALDVTEQRNALRNQSLVGGLMNAVRSLVDGWVWRTAPDGTVDDGLEWWTSVEGAHPPGTGWTREQFVHPDDRAEFRRAWERAIAERSTYRGRFRFRNAQQHYVQMKSVGMPVLTADGGLFGWVGITIADDERVSDIPPTEIPGALVRAARNYYDWSTADLAEAAGLSFSTVRRIEAGKGQLVGRTYVERAIAALTGQGASFHRDSGGRISVSFSPPPEPNA